MNTGIIKIGNRRKDRETGKSYYETINSTCYFSSKEVTTIIMYYRSIYNIDNYNIILTAIPDIGVTRKRNCKWITG